MSSLKTAAATLAVCVGLGSPGHASGDLFQIFAGCAGRFSAEVEQAWLLGSPHSERLVAQRDATLDLLDALGRPDGGAALHLRIAAKAAHAQLLSEAAFGQDKSRAAWARARSAEQIEVCRRWLLQG